MVILLLHPRQLEAQVLLHYVQRQPKKIIRMETLSHHSDNQQPNNRFTIPLRVYRDQLHTQEGHQWMKTPAYTQDQ